VPEWDIYSGFGGEFEKVENQKEIDKFTADHPKLQLS